MKAGSQVKRGNILCEERKNWVSPQIDGELSLGRHSRNATVWVRGICNVRWSAACASSEESRVPSQCLFFWNEEEQTEGNSFIHRK